LIAYKKLKKYDVNLRKWLFSAISSFFISIIFIVDFYYTYTGVFGIESLFLDGLSFIMGTTLGQLIALQIYTKSKLKQIHYNLLFALFFLMLISFVIFTFCPPNLPIFIEGS
jgi:hypothetical protein